MFEGRKLSYKREIGESNKKPKQSCNRILACFYLNLSCRITIAAD